MMVFAAQFPAEQVPVIVHHFLARDLSRVGQHQEFLHRGSADVFVNVFAFDEPLDRLRVAIVNRRQDVLIAPCAIYGKAVKAAGIHRVCDGLCRHKLQVELP
jgi:hypothetical protein